MNKLLLIIAFLGFQAAAFGQLSIRVSPNPAHGSGTIEEPDIKVDVSILNTSLEVVDLMWTRHVVDIPEQWLSYICDAQNCYLPEDSICPPSAQNIIQPGSSINFQVHILTAGVEGTAAINIEMYDRSDPDNILQTLETTFEVSETTSTDDPFALNDVRLYPNPASNYFRIYQAEGVAILDVYNMVGKRVRTYPATTDGQYDVSTLPDGMYIVRLLAKDNSVLKTLRLSKS